MQQAAGVCRDHRQEVSFLTYRLRWDAGIL
jgi:hypothetical protein